jgi:hypothetical protein
MSVQAVNSPDLPPVAERKAWRHHRLSALREAHPRLGTRVQRMLRFQASVRAVEYYVTNACNIRCQGCWFFQYGYDKKSREEKDLPKIREFLEEQTKKYRINAATIIGGEPTLFPDRLRIYVDALRYVTISSNGLKALPMEGFENVTIALTLFGGGPLDDKLRGILPSGQRISGLFDKVLENYHNDPRAGFVFALTEDGIDYIEPTVRRIAENGNILTFGFYSKYGSADPLAQGHQAELLAEALRVKALYPETVVSHPYYIEAVITGRSHFASFGYDVCPSLSRDHPDHRERFENGNPTLPFFNSWAADLETLNLCCVSGDCSGCRDSQAVSSWLLVSLDHFLGSAQHLETWLDIAEGYWKGFIWSPYHRTKTAAEGSAPCRDTSLSDEVRHLRRAS